MGVAGERGETGKAVARVCGEGWGGWGGGGGVIGGGEAGAANPIWRSQGGHVACELCDINPVHTNWLSFLVSDIESIY